MESAMDDVEKLLKGSVEELDKLLNAKNVLGEPIERDGAMVVPLVSYGFGFGAGGSSGGKTGDSGGSGAGGGIKPVGAIIFDGEGARVEAVKGAVSSIAEVLGAVAGRALDKGTKTE
ncbi:sporulation protein YtfJ [Rhodobacteraceae bacterium WD3A24]|nr:sporulation protein YtfJ [Rhodobacteraceae bacterium WD3A24]